MSSLYDRPDLYDLASPRDPEMERFYLKTAHSVGPRALELACGTGRLTIPLGLSGLDTVGGDLSAPMLDAARQAAKERSAAVDFVKLDMRDFDLGRPFDTIFVAANSLLHLHSEGDFQGFFDAVRRHLAPGGKLAFDIFVPSIQLLASDPAKRQPVGTFQHPSLGAVSLEETVRYDPLPQVSHVQWFWSTDETRDFWSMSLAMRQIFPAELCALLKANGFELTHRCGDFDGRAFSQDAWRQVCIATPL